MKFLLINIILLFFCFCTFSQEKALIGMSVNEFKNIYPNLPAPEKYENTITFTKQDTLYGLTGEWGYRFENNKLNWIFFHKYIDEINEQNFNKCLSSAEKIIYDFNNLYGKPDTIIKGNSTFRDPYVDHHWGYDVIEAQWKNFKGMKIKCEFTFMGGKGEYHFLVTINYFGKDYPYFD